MSRAEERALKAYPVKMEMQYDQETYLPLWEEDMNVVERVCFREGYEQAEKDLGWHSVDECLPELGEEVIVVWFEYGEVRTTPLQCVGLSQLYQPIQCVPSGEKLWTIPGVKYWMPMPKLPEEEEK